jgi:hypothetical protein
MADEHSLFWSVEYPSGKFREISFESLVRSFRWCGHYETADQICGETKGYSERADVVVVVPRSSPWELASPFGLGEPERSVLRSTSAAPMRLVAS